MVWGESVAVFILVFEKRYSLGGILAENWKASPCSYAYISEYLVSVCGWEHAAGAKFCISKSRKLKRNFFKYVGVVIELVGSFFHATPIAIMLIF